MPRLAVRMETTVLLLCLSLAGCASAPPPDPRAALAEATAAMRDLEGITYSYKYEGNGSLAGSFSGDVMIMRGATGRFRASIAGRGAGGSQAPAVDLTIASDGSRIEAVDRSSRTFSHGTLAGGAAHLSTYAYYAVLFQFLQEDPFAVETGGERIEWEGVEAVNGVECDVIRAQNNSFGGADVWWYLGREDRLPRAQKWKVTTPGVDGEFVFEIAGLDPRAGLGDAEFRLEAPDGYDVVDEDERVIGPGTPAPDWTLVAASGDPIVLSSLRGNVVVLDFWASWCTPCWTLMPAFDEMARQYESRPVRFLGLNSWESPDVDPAAYAREKQLAYPVLLNGEKLAGDYKIGSLPALFVIDAEGTIVFARSPVYGSPDEVLTGLRQAVDGALAGAAVP